MAQLPKLSDVAHLSVILQLIRYIQALGVNLTSDPQYQIQNFIIDKHIKTACLNKLRPLVRQYGILLTSEVQFKSGLF